MLNVPKIIIPGSDPAGWFLAVKVLLYKIHFRAQNQSACLVNFGPKWAFFKWHFSKMIFWAELIFGAEMFQSISVWYEAGRSHLVLNSSFCRPRLVLVVNISAPSKKDSKTLTFTENNCLWNEPFLGTDLGTWIFPSLSDSPWLDTFFWVRVKLGPVVEGHERSI